MKPYVRQRQTENDFVHLHIRAGEYIGLVGASGCGKSTLLKLLLGFEKPAFGRICYDNQDMANSDPGKLREKFGVVLQDGKLISGNIYDNITLSYPDADSREVRAVLHAIGFEEDIARMPMGLQTMVSEKCDTISTGQKQKAEGTTRRQTG